MPPSAWPLAIHTRRMMWRYPTNTESVRCSNLERQTERAPSRPGSDERGHDVREGVGNDALWQRRQKQRTQSTRLRQEQNASRILSGQGLGDWKSEAHPSCDADSEKAQAVAASRSIKSAGSCEASPGLLEISMRASAQCVRSCSAGVSSSGSREAASNARAVLRFITSRARP
jgi:hypothetical protein